MNSPFHFLLVKNAKKMWISFQRFWKQMHKIRGMLLNCPGLNIFVVVMYFLLLERKELLEDGAPVHLSHSSFAVFRSSYMILLAQRELCSLNRPFAEMGAQSLQREPRTCLWSHYEMQIHWTLNRSKVQLQLDLRFSNNSLKPFSIF